VCRCVCVHVCLLQRKCVGVLYLCEKICAGEKSCEGAFCVCVLREGVYIGASLCTLACCKEKHSDVSICGSWLLALELMCVHTESG